MLEHVTQHMRQLKLNEQDEGVRDFMVYLRRIGCAGDNFVDEAEQQVFGTQLQTPADSDPPIMPAPSDAPTAGPSRSLQPMQISTARLDQLAQRQQLRESQKRTK